MILTVNSTSPWVSVNSSHNSYQSDPSNLRLHRDCLEVQSSNGNWTSVPPVSLSVGLTPAGDSALSWAMEKMIEDLQMRESVKQSVGLHSGTKITQTLQAQINLVNQVADTVNKAIAQLDKERKKLEVLTQLSIDHDGTV